MVMWTETCEQNWIECLCVRFTAVVVVGQMDQNNFFFLEWAATENNDQSDCAPETKNQITRKSHWACCVWLNLFVYVSM